MNDSFFEKYQTSEVTNTRRIINTPSAFTREHFLYLQEAGYLKSLKPHLSTRQGLSSYLFVIVLSGTGTVTYREPLAKGTGGTKRTVSAGDCFFLDCRGAYTHISSADDPWELMWIHFHGAQADAYYQYFREQHSFYFHTSHVAELTASIQSIITCHERKNENTDILTAQQITNILTAICTEPMGAGGSNTALSSKLSDILQYLDAHYTEDISLDGLAEQFYISKYYLSREFKKEFGTTIIQYLLTKKITNAKELLRYSNSSIEEIARLCGIDDASYFNKVFRKIEGCTASEYRKKW
jgi:AraC-like DNA-binding protein